jgi:hypothetical protein
MLRIEAVIYPERNIEVSPAAGGPNTIVAENTAFSQPIQLEEHRRITQCARATT